MPTVEISVNGRQHVVQCGEGEESRVRQLASYIDRRIADLGRGQAQAGDARLLLMASLMVADELSDASTRSSACATALEERGRGEAERAGGRCWSRLAQRIEAIAAAAGESLTKPGRVLPGALGPRKPWGQRFSVRELSLPGPWPRYYGAHLRQQATEESSVPTAVAAPHFRLPRASARAVSIVRPPELVRRKAALRAVQRRKRRAAAATLGGTAAEAVAERLVRELAAAGCRHRRPATGRSRTSSIRGPAWTGLLAPATRSPCRACRGAAVRSPSMPGDRAIRCSPGLRRHGA